MEEWVTGTFHLFQEQGGGAIRGQFLGQVSLFLQLKWLECVVVIRRGRLGIGLSNRNIRDNKGNSR
jgi:hypothetical protein